MDKIRELRIKAANKMKERASLVELAVDENRDSTEDELAKVDTLKLESEKLFKQAELLEQSRADIAALHIPASPRPATLVTGKPRWEDDPKKGFSDIRDFMRTTLTVGPDGRVTDERLRYLTAGTDEQGTYSDPYGGFLVPTGILPGVLSVGMEANPCVGVRMIPMSSPKIEVNARVDKDHSSTVSGGLTVYRRSEATQMTASRMAFEQIKLEATGLYGLTYVTEEQISDSPDSIIALIASGFGDEFQNKLIKERLNGTGVGQFLGVWNSDAYQAVAAETSQATDTIVLANVLKMRSRCWGYDRAVWIANHDCYPQLAQLNLPVGTGGVAVYQTSAVQDRPDLLLGRPIFYSEYADTIGDAHDITLINWGEFLEGTYQPLQSGESMHLRFDYHERAFKFFMRNAGQPWWRTYLTPLNSTNYLSPYVGLASR